MRSRLFYGQFVRCVVLLLLLALVSSAMAGPTLAFIVTQTSTLINTFISGLAPEGGIIIHKTVEHPFGERYEIPEHIGFGFRVDLGVEYAGKEVITSKGNQTADSSGSIIVTVKPDESVAIREILAGTLVTVTELAPSPGFAVADGITTKTVVVAPRTDTTVHFVNTYTPTPVSNKNLEVTGIKNLEGRPWQDGDTFTFLLEHRRLDDAAAQWTEVGTASVSYNSDVENFNFFDLTELVHSVTYDRIGTYSFRVSEIEGVIGGVTYDDLVSYFDVQVTDADMDGTLEFAKVTGSAGAEVLWDEVHEAHCVTVTFSNHYAPAGSAAVSIPIRKMVEDRSGQTHTAEGFTFELYTLNGQLLQTSKPTAVAGETSLRMVYEAAQAGQFFSYIVKETGAGTVNGAMHYDAKEYVIHVTVKDNLDGTISAEADLKELSFVNIYDPQDAQLLVQGTKTLEGRALREGEFTFQLYTANSEFATEQDAQPLSTVVNTVEGGFSFEPLTYEQIGTYYYIIREDASAELPGITYDDTAYRLTVTVTDEEGVLTAQTAITNADGQDAELTFRNIYRPVAALLQLGGKKVLQGAQLTSGQFHFTLFAADEGFNAHEQPLQTTTNAADGSFRFEQLVYEQTGTYYYIIREEIVDPIEDMIYDDTIYAVTVTVTDDGNGALLTQTAMARIGGGATDEIVFENVYMPDDPTPPDPPKPDEPDDPQPPKTDNPQTLAPYFIMIGLSLLLLFMLMSWDKDNRRYK